jgi:hypothetical protein
MSLTLPMGMCRGECTVGQVSCVWHAASAQLQNKPARKDANLEKRSTLVLEESSRKCFQTPFAADVFSCILRGLSNVS